MSTKQRFAEKNRTLRKTETVALPDLGESVILRSLNLGEQWQFTEKKGFARVATMIALSVVDPETGQLMYNPNAKEDHDLIADFSPADSTELTNAIMRLNGMTEEEKEEMGKTSLQSGNSSSSSPPVTVYLPDDSNAD